MLINSGRALFIPTITGVVLPWWVWVLSQAKKFQAKREQPISQPKIVFCCMPNSSIASPRAFKVIPCPQPGTSWKRKWKSISQWEK
jgi:hypothetical protein